VGTRLANGEWPRFGTVGRPTLIQCAEQLEDPAGVLFQTYSDATWQDGTLNAARAVAHAAAGAIDSFGAALGLDGLPTEVTLNGRTWPRAGLQYLETHDHSRLLAEFGTVQPDEAGNYLFLAGDRTRWFKLQPYLIALLTAKGIPMLFEGEELGEDFTLPGNGLGRIGLLRPVNWDYFYDTPGRTLVTLVRTLLTLRRAREEIRSDNYFYYRDPANYQNNGVMIFHRTSSTASTVVAVNFSDAASTVELSFPLAGHWTSQLPGGADLDVTGGAPSAITVPSNYGRIWTIG
jgi:glycosidase